MSPDPKPPVRGGLGVRVYALMERAVEDGVRVGWSRAHKHEDDPEPETVRMAVADAVLNELCEWFSFPEDG